MTGWRIGYVMAPEYLIETIKNINENNVFTAPSVSQGQPYSFEAEKRYMPSNY